MVLATGERSYVDPTDINDPNPDPDAPANDVPGVPSAMPSGND